VKRIFEVENIISNWHIRNNDLSKMRILPLIRIATRFHPEPLHETAFQMELWNENLEMETRLNSQNYYMKKRFGHSSES